MRPKKSDEDKKRYQQEYKEKNKEKLKIYLQNYRKKNRYMINEYFRDLYEKNKDEIKQKKNCRSCNKILRSPLSRREGLCIACRYRLGEINRINEINEEVIN